MAPCSDAIVKQVVCARPDQSVEQALQIFKEHNIRTVPVVDKDGIFHGVFGLREVLVELLPTAVKMQDGLEDLDFILDAEPGIAKRLKKLRPRLIGDVMNKKIKVAHPSTSTWEVLRMMTLYGSPVAIVEKESKKFVGVVSRQTLLEELENLIEATDAENDA